MSAGRTLALAAAVALAAFPPAGRAAHAAKAPPQVTRVTLLVRHRAFPDFFDVDSVALKEEFEIGDTPYTARVVEFVPDFAMDLKTHRIFSRTNEPNNPAFRVIVREKKVPQDTVWAFFNMPPHFARKSLLAFMVGRIEFKGHPTMMIGDTTATRVPRRPPQAADSTAARATAPGATHAAAGKDSARAGAGRP